MVVASGGRGPGAESHVMLWPEDSESHWKTIVAESFFPAVMVSTPGKKKKSTTAIWVVEVIGWHASRDSRPASISNGDRMAPRGLGRAAYDILVSSLIGTLMGLARQRVRRQPGREHGVARREPTERQQKQPGVQQGHADLRDADGRSGAVVDRRHHLQVAL